MKTVGFVGLGAMGLPMAAQVLKKGFPLVVTAHRRRDALEQLVAQGAQEAATVAALAGRVDVLITMVPDAPQVREVVEAALAARPRPGFCHIDMSTVNPAQSRDFGALWAAAGFDFMDAPVSGGPFRAQDGSLAILAGADEAVFERHKDVLCAMGRPVRMGPVGMGEVVKLVNNTAIAVAMAGLIEALEMGRAAGADPAALREALLDASAASYLLEKWLPNNYMKDDFSQGFAMSLLHKDLSAALALAGSLNQPMTVTALCQQLYRQGMMQGLGALDYSALAKLYREPEQ